MADFCSLSTASSNPIEPDNNSSKTVSADSTTPNQNGQLWKKIGLVGSVAVMGGQPVLAQIDLPAGDVVVPPVVAETEVAPTAATPEVSVSVTSPTVATPEPAAPSFSNAAPAVQAEPITSPPTVVETPPIEAAVVTDTEPVASSAAAAPTVDTVTAEAEETPAPSQETVTPEIDIVTPDVDTVTPDVDTVTPEVDVVTPAQVEATTPAVDIVKPSDVVPEAIPTVEDLAAEFGGVFVDPTAYSEGATLSPEAPEVFVSERSTGCEYKVNAKSLGDNCGVSGKQPTVANAPRTIIPRAAINIGPVSISQSGVRFTGSVAAVASREYYNTVAKPLVDLQAGESFVFPLASPSPITSLFGWRWHPIHNDYRFHSGTDLGAPQGTPILATQSGQVSVADYLGGYGLTVILRHSDNTLESRYAHMSHMLVQPGEWVEQGDVIGLVGSTGNSTGPHLHFELHQLTGQGWVTINPNEVMSYALANLNNRFDGGNPLQALNIMPKAQASPIRAALPKAVKTETLVKDAPHFRPAQPHAQ
ncbi:MAG: peptidoglycan DD-metalloendopeptidase family protein [Cyanobacteria bacterium P01_F01_bin.13]